MTQTTEQERPKREDFEKWAISTNQGYDLTRNQSGRMQTYEHDKTEHAWRGFFHGMQAARRAPVVPQGWKITEEMHVAAVKVLHSASGVDGLPQRMVDAMLAAAPQPPDCNLSMQPLIESLEVVSAVQGMTVTRLNLSEAGRAALQSKAGHIPAVGQMVAVPETAHASVKAAVHANLGTYRRVMAKRSTEAAPVQMPEPYDYVEWRERGFSKTHKTALYTEHQVRKLLAQKESK